MDAGSTVLRWFLAMFLLRCFLLDTEQQRVLHFILFLGSMVCDGSGSVNLIRSIDLSLN